MEMNYYNTEIDDCDPAITNKLWPVFDKYCDKCASTADFIYDFTNALPENTNGLAFAVYICEYTNFKFKKLNKNPISSRIYGDYMTANEFCDFLFNKCGTSGWDIVHAGFNSLKLIHGHMRFVYAIYVR